MILPWLREGGKSAKSKNELQQKKKARTQMTFCTSGFRRVSSRLASHSNFRRILYPPLPWLREGGKSAKSKNELHQKRRRGHTSGFRRVSSRLASNSNFGRIIYPPLPWLRREVNLQKAKMNFTKKEGEDTHPDSGGSPQDLHLTLISDASSTLPCPDWGREVNLQKAKMNFSKKKGEDTNDLLYIRIPAGLLKTCI